MALTLSHMIRVGQNRISAPYITVSMVITLPKIPFIHIYTVCTYKCMVLANPTNDELSETLSCCAPKLPSTPSTH